MLSLPRCLPAGMLAILIGVVGCGGAAETRFQVSGTVTYKNQPVENGDIYFEPDFNTNPTGMQGYAKIKNGKYSTADGGKGISGGAYFIKVEGYGPVDTKTDPPTAKPLFRTYSIKEDLPKSDTTKDVPVPEGGGKPDTSNSRGNANDP